MLDARRFVMAFGLSALLAASASAQVYVITGQAIGLLKNPKVQKELHLDQDQVERAVKATESAIKQVRESPGKRKEIAAAYESEVVALLKPEQRKRLRELTLQMRGGEAFQDAAVRDALKLTDGQRAKIDEILLRAIQAMQEAIRLRRDPVARRTAQEKTRLIRSGLLEDILAVLDDGQKEAWKEMNGEPSELDSEPSKSGGAERSPPRSK